MDNTHRLTPLTANVWHIAAVMNSAFPQAKSPPGALRGRRLTRGSLCHVGQESLFEFLQPPSFIPNGAPSARSVAQMTKFALGANDNL